VGGSFTQISSSTRHRLAVYTVCNPPTIPTLLSSANNVCPSTAVTLEVASGNLNDATGWQWYTGACGGVSVGSGVNIVVNPTVTTTYFVRGEGGCVSPGSCASITITVVPTSTGTDVQTACNSYTWIDGVTYTASNNTATHTLTNANGCDSLLTLNLTIESIQDQTLTAVETVLCPANTGTTISLGSSEVGVTYFLRDDADNTVVDGPNNGTGSAISFNTGSLSATKTFNVLAETYIETALTFSGSGQYLSVGNILPQSYTKEAWVYIPGPNGLNNNIASGAGGASTHALFIPASAGYRLSAGNYSPWNQVQDPTPITFGQWINVAVTYDATSQTMRLYKNGALVSQATGVNPLSSSNPLLIASYTGGGNTLGGRLDDVRIWNYARSATEIADNYSSCLNGNETGLLAYYRFEDGTGSAIATDLTNNNYHATLVNMNPSTAWVTSGFKCTKCDLEMPTPITITVNSASTGADIQSHCDIYTWIDGITYTSSNNTATHTLTNAAGCDSLVTLNLTITNSTTNTTTASTCDSYTWSENGQTYTASGTYAVITGCHTEELVLTITNSTTNTTTANSCDSYTWSENGQTYTASGTYTVVTGCHTEELVLTISTNTAPSSIGVAGVPYCLGGVVSLSVQGGSLDIGANWEWTSGTCGGTAEGTGNTINVSPSSTTTYFVKAGQGTYCPASSCATITVEAANISTNLSVNNDAAPCYVEAGNWIHFYNSDGRLIASVNSMQDLGVVTASSYINSSPHIVPTCFDLTNPLYQSAALARSFVITPTNPLTSGNTAQVRIYFSDDEWVDYLNAANNVTLSNPNDTPNSLSDLQITKFSHNNPSSENGSPLDNCGNGTGTLIYNSSSGTDLSTVGLNGFSNSRYLQFTVDGFSEFYAMFNNFNSALPVTLTSFNANCLDNKTRISWTTASEIHSSHYILQASRDGTTWLHLAEIVAAGTTNQQSNYVYDDFKNVGVSFYRLVQVDLDGVQEVFGPITSNCEIESSHLSAFPNPIHENFTVLLETPHNFGNAEIELIDISGRVILSQTIEVNTGSTMFNFDSNNLFPGTYIVRVKGMNDIFTPIRVVKI